jgi:2-C-methyl-D-erythritol 4-phosphate cytidylyltransferase / 2-C-methyl-D-erythritol 2,4-cyclodiphosphate synthase
MSKPLATQTVALIVAAGSGARFGAGLPKQYSRLAGVSILRHSVLAFMRHPGIAATQVVIGAGHEAWYAEATAGLSLPPPVLGGATRQQSVRLGLEAWAMQQPLPDWVLVHDAARPLVTAHDIDAVLAALVHGPAAIAALPVHDTLKRAASNVPIVSETVDRAGLWRAMTPQGFHFMPLLLAHRRAADATGLTDDADVAQRAGMAVTLVPCSPDAMKITTMDDLRKAEALCHARLGDVRVGCGYDVHRFAPGDHVWLCGVKIPHGATLQGHSDADVALHALTDAIFGALGEGDIGSHFPPSDPQWKGAASHLFVRHAMQRLEQRGGILAHLDLTIICERPTIGPHREELRAHLARITGIALDRVSVKATTTEGLGFTGRREGIAAQATATVRLPMQAKEP